LDALVVEGVEKIDALRHQPVLDRACSVAHQHQAVLRLE
jgi:hypothetical protein